MDGHQISILPEAGLWDFLAALSEFRKSMFCIKLLISRCLFIAIVLPSVGHLYGESDRNKMVEELEGIYFYENPRTLSMTTMQYQLRGILTYEVKEVHEDGAQMVLIFSGKVEMRSTGGGLGDTNQKQQLITWEVHELPVRIKRWAASTAPWADNTFTYLQAFELAKALTKNQQRFKAAIKTPSFLMADNGALLGIYGDEIIFDVKY